MDVTTEPPNRHRMDASTNGSLKPNGVSNGVVAYGNQGVEVEHLKTSMNGRAVLPSSRSVGDDESPLNPLLQSRVKDFVGTTASFPHLAWIRPLDSLPVPVKEFSLTLAETLKCIPLGLRLYTDNARARQEGRIPVIDPFKWDVKPHSGHGVPLGGIGACSIGRGWQGDFNRWQFIPGQCEHGTEHANQFSVFVRRQAVPGGLPSRYSSVLNPNKPPLARSRGALSSSSSLSSSQAGGVGEPTAGDATPTDSVCDFGWLGMGGGARRDANGTNTTTNTSTSASAQIQASAAAAAAAAAGGREGAVGRGGMSASSSGGSQSSASSSSPGIESWNWEVTGQGGAYCALFPRAWTLYQEPDPELTIVCRQVSPFVPHNYQESSLPCGVFNYTLLNSGDSIAHTTLLFTFANSIGGSSGLTGGHYNEPFEEDHGVKGVVLHHLSPKIGGPVSLAIAAQASEHVHVSVCPRFAISGPSCGYSALDMWQQIEEAGSFPDISPQAHSLPLPSFPGSAIGAAVAATVCVPPGATVDVTFSLSWDVPIAKFNPNSSYLRRYTRFYGHNASAAPVIARDALLGFHNWEAAIDAWQKPILNDASLPDWFRVTLFNELYFLTAGGTVWTDGGPRLEERKPNEWPKRLRPCLSRGQSVGLVKCRKGRVGFHKATGAQAAAAAAVAGAVESPATGGASPAMPSAASAGFPVEGDSQRGGGRTSPDGALTVGAAHPSLVDAAVTPARSTERHQESESGPQSAPGIARAASAPSFAFIAVQSPVASPELGSMVGAAGGQSVHERARAGGQRVGVFSLGLRDEEEEDEWEGYEDEEDNWEASTTRGALQAEKITDKGGEGGGRVTPEALSPTTRCLPPGMPKAPSSGFGSRKAARVAAAVKAVSAEYYSWHHCSGAALPLEEVGGGERGARENGGQRRMLSVEEEMADGRAMDRVGQFLYLEGLEYVMWNTYDVHFYASFALLELFPLLELSLQRDIAASTLLQQRRVTWFLAEGHAGVNKGTAGSVPHDVGNVDPWLYPNSYNIHDTTKWKDLNCKFVLQVCRDFKSTRNLAFCRAVWPSVRAAMEYMLQFDRDGDGMIENDGFPDQTYDIWAVQGVSAYCGGLWLAALKAGQALAEALGQQAEVDKWRELEERAKKVYVEKLWTGNYFRYDNSKGQNSDSIQADQLAGQMYLLSAGLPRLFDTSMSQKALQMVFEYNVMKVRKGTMGAVNGMKPNGQVDDSCMQSREIWTGVTYLLAATMMFDGMKHQAFRTAEGIYRAGWEDYGYWFQTPEGWDTNGRYRSLAYMRPLAIWAMYHALKPPS